MTRSARRLRGLFSATAVVAGAALGLGWVVGCNTATVTPATECTGSQCTCEQDPLQPRCRGYNDRPESGAIDKSDAQWVDATPDAGEADDAGDAASDGPDDAGDAADGAD